MTVSTVLLLPGLDGTGDLFAPFVDAAPRGIKTVVVEYAVTDASIEVLERHARERLVKDCIVIAESFSGPIGIRVAADARVRALVLCNSFIKSPVFPLLRHLAIAPLFAIPLPKFALRSFLLGRRANPVLLEKTQRAIRRIPATVLARRVRQILLADEQTAVRTVAKPILYLRGLSDKLV
jgi:pimeloyl-[acyl-carrier protein] methyl ester esterase